MAVDGRLLFIGIFSETSDILVETGERYCFCGLVGYSGKLDRFIIMNSLGLLVPWAAELDGEGYKPV